MLIHYNSVKAGQMLKAWALKLKSVGQWPGRLEDCSWKALVSCLKLRAGNQKSAFIRTNHKLYDPSTLFHGATLLALGWSNWTATNELVMSF